MKSVGEYTYNEEVTNIRFAWFPRYLTSGRLIWLTKYFETKIYTKTPHYCHDCVNLITPCDGRAFDTSVQVKKVYK